MGRSGYFDWVVQGQAVGWVSFQPHADGVANLVFLVNGQEVGRLSMGGGVAAGQRIPYIYKLPFHGTEEKWLHHVEVRWADTGQVLPGSPQWVSGGGVSGHFGGIRQLHLIGWATSQMTSRVIPVLDVWDGDALIAKIQPESIRPDLSWIGEPGPIGIRAFLPEILMDGEPHVIHLRSAAGDALRGSPVTFQATPDDQAQWRSMARIFRVQQLQKDLQFEESVAQLKSWHREEVLDIHGQCALAESLLLNNQAEEARVLIDAQLDAPVLAWVWVELKLRWLEFFGVQWRDVWAESVRLAPRLRGSDRLDLLFAQIRMLSKTCQFRRAERLLGFYDQIVLTEKGGGNPQEKISRVLKSMAVWQAMGRFDQSQHLLEWVQRSPVSGHQQEVMIWRAIVQERETLRRTSSIVGWLGQLPVSSLMSMTILPPPQGLELSEVARSQRIAVLLHLFYPALWDDFSDQLHRLKASRVRLFVTVGVNGLPERVRQALYDIDESAVIKTVENRGFDIGAHWQSLDSIDLKAFDLVMLLQSKRSDHIASGAAWRTNLRDALMGSWAVWQANLEAFAKNPRLGLIGSLLHRGYRDSWQYKAMREVLEALGLPTQFDAIRPLYEYVSGTMFIIRAHLLAEMHERTRSKLHFPLYEELSVGHRLDHSLAHAMERAFGIYTRWRGYDIGWRGAVEA